MTNNTETVSYTMSIDEEFMKHAKMAAALNGAALNKVGACIVKDGKIISVGCYKMAILDFPENMRQLYEIHAVMTAISSKNSSIAGGTIYITRPPCNECAKVIVQEKLREVVLLYDKIINNTIYEHGQKLLREAQIAVRTYTLNDAGNLVVYCNDSLQK